MRLYMYTILFVYAKQKLPWFFFFIKEEFEESDHMTDIVAHLVILKYRTSESGRKNLPKK